MSVPVGQAGELYVETGVGSITVTGADVTDCNITAEITVKAETEEEARKLAEQVKIEVKPDGDKLSVKVSKPSELKKRGLEVKFKIVAPKQLKLVCSINVGSATISDMNGRIKVSGNVGSISCRRVVGDLNLTSNVGSIKVDYADTAAAACNAAITTNVGSIEFTAPAQLSAQVSASANVGSVKTDKPITVVGKVGKSITGTIGAGEGKVRLKTNVGSIHIK
jgi:predicted membrane protein